MNSMFQSLVVSFLPWEDITTREFILHHFPHVRSEWIKATKFDINDDIKNQIKYTVNGKTHREDGPAVIITRPNGSREEKYYIDDRHYRKSGPATVIIHPDGSRENYYYNNSILKSIIIIHSDWFHEIRYPYNPYYGADGPATIKIAPKDDFPIDKN